MTAAPTVRPGRAETAGVWAVVGVGGAVGSLARWAVAVRTPDGSRLPWGTLVVNVTGAFALGLLVVLVARRRPRSRYVLPFLGTGLLGGYTTFSAVMLELRDLGAASRPGAGAAYVALTLVLGIGAAVAGMALAGAIATERAPVACAPAQADDVRESGA